MSNILLDTIMGVISNSSSPHTDVVSNHNQVKEDHVKRPLNKFMCYSKLERAKIRKENPRMNQKDISSMLGKKWKTLSPAEQQEYEQKAVDLKHLHQTQFPQYKYRPKRRGTSTKKTRYSSEGLQKIQPAIHQSTQKPYMMSELNNYPLAVMPDECSIGYNFHNVRSDVPTDSSKPSTSGSPEGDDQVRSLHETQYPDYKFCPKGRGTSTKKTRYCSDGLRQIQPAIYQPTRKPHMMSNTNPTVNNYPLGSIPDGTDEPPMFNIQNVCSDVPTDSSKPSTSDSPGEQNHHDYDERTRKTHKKLYCSVTGSKNQDLLAEMQKRLQLQLALETTPTPTPEDRDTTCVSGLATENTAHLLQCSLLTRPCTMDDLLEVNDTGRECAENWKKTVYGEKSIFRTQLSVSM